MTYASTILGQSPVHYWRLQESSGSSGADAGSSPVAMTFGTADLGQAGAYAGSTSHFFDAVGDAHSATIAALSSAAYTVSFLCKLHATFPTTFHETALSLDVDGTQRAHFHPRHNQSPFPVAYWDNTNTFKDSTAAALSATPDWHHLAFVVNGTNVVIYIDGVAAGSFTITAPADNYIHAYIGASGEAAANQMKGWIQDVALFSSAKTAGDILAQYNAFLGIGGGGASGWMIGAVAMP